MAISKSHFLQLAAKVLRLVLNGLFVGTHTQGDVLKSARFRSASSLSMRSLCLITIGACACALTACASFGFGGNPAGVRIVGKQKYCGSASQASEVHYFATQAGFDNWVDFRDLNNWHEKVRQPGLMVVEMGQRPTGGYKLKLDNDATRIKDDVLTVGFEWDAPRLDAAVSQAMTTQCVAIALPDGQYRTVDVQDQLGNSRGSFAIDR